MPENLMLLTDASSHFSMDSHIALTLEEKKEKKNLPMYNSTNGQFMNAYRTPPSSGGFAGWFAKRQRTGTRYGWSSTGTTLTKKRRPRRGQYRTFQRRVLNVFPAKHVTNSVATTILNGRIYTMNLTQQILQGAAGDQREGDSVMLEALKISGHFQTSTESNGFIFRILVGYSGEEYNTPTLAVGNLSVAELFQPNTATQITNGIINPKAFTVLFDHVIDLNSQIEGDRTLQSLKETIKLNKKFPYQAFASLYGKTQNLYMVVCSNQPDTAIDVPNGSAILSYDLIYKD